MLRCNTVVSRLWQEICRKTSAGSCKSLTIPVRIKTSWLKLVFTAMIAITIAGCGAGGGGGGGGSGSSSSSSSGGETGNSAGGSSGSTDFIVSGSVSAPGGAVAFLPRKNLFAKFTDVLFSPVYAAISGLASVPDGTKVDLARINNTGAVISVLATTTTSGGSYFFNLTKLNLTTASDLVVQVLDSSNVLKMRAFVATGTVNVDPVSETTVRLVLEKSAISSLNNFTTQELADIVAAVNLLAMTKPLATGLDIEATVTAFKNAVAADTNITAFITAASVTGQTSQGLGDIGNYFPFDQRNTWVYQGTEESGGIPTPYMNTLQITGTKLINGITTTIFHETNSGNTGGASEDYLVKGNQAITYYGNNVATDFLTPQVGTYRQYVFPLGLNLSFEAINKSGLTWPDSLGDGDGKPETASLNASVTVAGFETVTVPAGTYLNAAKIVSIVNISAILSADGATATETITTTEWYAPGIGLVKSVSVEQTTAYNVTDTTTTTEDLIRFSPPLSFLSISSGHYFTCGITIQGAAYCWGSNPLGGLGDGITTSSTTPIEVSGGLTFTSISVGEYHVCGVTTNNVAYCWGYNIFGALGNGTNSISTTPVPVAGGLNFKSVSASSDGYHTCGITISGVAYCWGGNSWQQLGHGAGPDSTTPVPVTGSLVFSSVSTAFNQSCGITTAGAAYCWGYNGSGQLGDGTTTDKAIPTLVVGGLVFNAVSAGVDHSCGVTTSGAAYCWGYNGSGQLGNDTAVNSASPVPVTGGHVFSVVSAGWYHTCGIATGGVAYCWGNGMWGQLGNNIMYTTYTGAPAAVWGGMIFSSISAGPGAHSCGVTENNTGYCWGDNEFGKLGSLSSSAVPVPVLAP